MGTINNMTICEIKNTAIGSFDSLNNTVFNNNTGSGEMIFQKYLRIFQNVEH